MAAIKITFPVYIHDDVSGVGIVHDQKNLDTFLSEHDWNGSPVLRLETAQGPALKAMQNAGEPGAAMCLWSETDTQERIERRASKIKE